MKRLLFALVLAACFFGACSDGDPEPTTGPSSATPEASEPISSTSLDVEVKGGEVVGGLKRVDVPLGDEVRLTVRSDVADEVHVHGYDEKTDIAAGGGILMTFTADVPGVFIIELEEAQLHIAELEVR